jgi:hypothetical protein
VDVVPIEDIIPLDGDHVAGVFQVFRSRPAKFLDNDVLAGGKANLSIVVTHTPAAMESLLLLGVSAQKKKLDSEVLADDVRAKRTTHRDCLKDHLGVEPHPVFQPFEYAGQTL